MFFARPIGLLHWCCPICNHLSRTKLKAPYKALHCSQCKTMWEYGMVIYQSPKGPRQIPLDTLMIADGFTTRRLVNRVYCDKCSVELSKPLLQNLTQSPIENEEV